LFESLPLCLKRAATRVLFKLPEENEHKDYYEDDSEKPGRAISPGAAIAPSRESPYEHEDKKN